MRVLSTIGLICIAFFLPLQFFIVGAILHMLIFAPYEVIILAVCIDAQFGSASITFGYLYTTSAILGAIAVTLMKPYLLIYSK